MYQQVKELRACIDKMYSAAIKQDDERRKEIETLKTYLSFALSAFGSISSCKYALCGFCKHCNECGTLSCGESQGSFMNKICPYDEFTPMSLTDCHQCGFRLICSEYEKALRYMYSYIRMGNSARICGKRIMVEDLKDIYKNKIETIKNSCWRWTSNEKLLKDIAVRFEVRDE